MPGCFYLLRHQRSIVAGVRPDQKQCWRPSVTSDFRHFLATKRRPVVMARGRFRVTHVGHLLLIIAWLPISLCFIDIYPLFYRYGVGTFNSFGFSASNSLIWRGARHSTGQHADPLAWRCSFGATYWRASHYFV